MTSDRSLQGALDAWLHEDQHEDATRVLHIVLDGVPTTPQHRPGWSVEGILRMNKFVVFGLGAAAVVAVLLIGLNLFRSSNPPPGGAPSDSEAPSEPAPSAAAFVPEGPVVVWESTHKDAPSITMTISASGWSYGTALPDSPATWLEKGAERDNVPEATVYPDSLPPGTGFYVYGDPCQSASTRPETPATTVDEIVAALAAQASRDASEPVDVTVGGYAGKMITLHVPDDADFADCDGGEFASYTIEGEERWQWQQGRGQIDDFWFVDVEGSIVELRASYRPDTPVELYEEMRTLVESATYEFP